MGLSKDSIFKCITFSCPKVSHNLSLYTFSQSEFIKTYGFGPISILVTPKSFCITKDQTFSDSQVLIYTWIYLSISNILNRKLSLAFFLFAYRYAYVYIYMCMNISHILTICVRHSPMCFIYIKALVPLDNSLR